MSSDQSPSPHDQARSDTIAHFKAEARRAFNDICARYGLKEQALTAADEGNDFTVLFANRKLRVLVEGINWGDNAMVSLGANKTGAQQYSVWQLMNERPPPSPVTGTQIQQLYGFARYLEGHASDVLAGDTHFFAVLDLQAEKRRRQAEAEHQAAARLKRDQGYSQVVSPFGSTIWRKPR